MDSLNWKKMEGGCRKIGSKISSFFYPMLCLACLNPLTEKRLFCEECTPSFECMDHDMRCHYCFKEISKKGVCSECISQKKWKIKMASVWEHQGAVLNFLLHLKQGSMPYLNKTAGAFLLIQFNRLQWPMPDLIIPMPKRRLFQGNHSELKIATLLGKHLNVPIRQFVGRRKGDLPQHVVERVPHERISSFYLKRRSEIEGKTILIIDDIIASGTTMISVAEKLIEGAPKAIYGLSLSRKEIS